MPKCTSSTRGLGNSWYFILLASRYLWQFLVDQGHGHEITSPCNNFSTCTAVRKRHSSIPLNTPQYQSPFGFTLSSWHCQLTSGCCVLRHPTAATSSPVTPPLVQPSTAFSANPDWEASMFIQWTAFRSTHTPSMTLLRIDSSDSSNRWHGHYFMMALGIFATRGLFPSTSISACGD